MPRRLSQWRLHIGQERITTKYQAQGETASAKSRPVPPRQANEPEKCPAFKLTQSGPLLVMQSSGGNALLQQLLPAAEKNNGNEDEDCKG